jgi:hypothetical protein
MKALVEHCGEILGNAIHAPRTDRLDARLLNRLENSTRLLACRLQAPMQRRVVAGKPQRNGIGVAADDCGFSLAELAGRLRQTDFPAHQAGPLGRERYLEVRLAREGTNTAGHRALERLGRRFLRSRLALDIGGHSSAPK